MMEDGSKNREALPTHPPLPPGWQKIHCDNGVYYWNQETNKTQWKFPIEEAEEFQMKKATHGYVNVPGEESPVSPVVYDSVQGEESQVLPVVYDSVQGEESQVLPVVYDSVQAPEGRAGDSHAPDRNELDRSPSPCAPPLYDEIDVTKLIKAPLKVTTQDISADSPHSPRMMRLESDSSTPPAIPARLYIEDSLDDNGSSSPPPIPARNYLDEEVLTSEKPALYLPGSSETSPVPHESSYNDEDESPPPIPTRTSLSEQLLLPTPVDELSYLRVPAAPDSSSEANRPEGGRYIVTEDGTRHFVLYDDGMAYAEMTVPEQKKHPMSKIVFQPLPPPPTAGNSSLESAEVSPAEVHQYATPSQSSDGMHALDSANSHKYHCLEETNLDRCAAPLPCKEADEANRQPDILDLTPPSPINPFSRKLVPAYEVVPLGGTPAGQSVDESGYMKVDSLQRNIQAKQTALKPENSQSILPEQPPQLPERAIKRSPSLKEKQMLSSQQKAPSQSSLSPKKNYKTFGFWSRKKNVDDASHVKQEAQASCTEDQYDRLQHKTPLQHLNATFPRNLEEPNYSRLNMSDEAVLLRSGVTLRRTIVSVADSIDLKLDLDQLNTPVPLIHAPNAPTANIQRMPHTYEECDPDVEEVQRDSECRRDLDAPVLTWDNSDLPPAAQLSNEAGAVPSGGSPAAKRSLGKNEKTSLSKVLQKPKGVSDEDYERRLHRLQHHEYPELDILEWPTSGDEKTPPMRRASEIKAVVRESWMSGAPSQEGLPPGWKQEVNEQGQVFYWHIPTGNIQYVRPESNSALKIKSQSPPNAGDGDSHSSPGPSKPPRATTFAAKYMGSLNIPEGTLVKGRSVHVVHNSIEALSESGDLEGVEEIGFRKGDSMYLQIKGMELRWLDPETSTVKLLQAINRIRVWGIGQENERDFGYVSRNPHTNQHQCHVFRCDIAARGVARALLDNHHHSKAKSQNPGTSDSPGLRKLDQTAGSGTQSRELSLSAVATADGAGTVLVSVPLTADERLRSVSKLQDPRTVNSFDSAEKYKRMDVVYIGSTETKGAHGINHINEAVSKLTANKSRWMDVHVDVASSHIKIIDRNTEQVLKEHRVRFLSFLGIAKDDRFCGYIVDSGDNQFHFYGFYCLPNTDRLCLALHSACQARYQRVLDAHMDGEMKDTDALVHNSKTKSQSLLNRLGSLKKKKDPEETELLRPSAKSYIVHFLGMEPVPKSEGVDAVRGPIRRMTEARKGVHLVELTVASSGFTITDPQKHLFSKRQIPTKKVTYCVRIKNHLAFIAKEGSKFVCYAFSESEVDAGTIVAAVQKILA